MADEVADEVAVGEANVLVTLKAVGTTVAMVTF